MEQILRDRAELFISELRTYADQLHVYDSDNREYCRMYFHLTGYINNEYFNFVMKVVRGYEEFVIEQSRYSEDISLINILLKEHKIYNC